VGKRHTDFHRISKGGMSSFSAARQARLTEYFLDAKCKIIRICIYLSLSISLSSLNNMNMVGDLDSEPCFWPYLNEDKNASAFASPLYLSDPCTASEQ
jgi:hypothetical protein